MKSDNSLIQLKKVFDEAFENARAILQENCQHQDNGFIPVEHHSDMAFHGTSRLFMTRYCLKCSKNLESYPADDYYDKFLNTEEKRQARLKKLAKRSYGYNPEFIKDYKGQLLLAHLSGGVTQSEMGHMAINETSDHHQPTKTEQLIYLEKKLKEYEQHEKEGRKWYYIVELKSI